MRKYLLAATFAIATLTGCATDGNDRNTRILTGAAVGGVLGNVLGNGSTGATVGGAVVGGAIGAHTGRNRDNRDYRHTNRNDRATWAYNDCLRRGYDRYTCQDYVNRNFYR